jgi:hypothetical protein
MQSEVEGHEMLVSSMTPSMLAGVLQVGVAFRRDGA